MMSIENKIIKGVKDGIQSLYGADVDEKQIQVQQTRSEFEGQLTVVVFPFLRASKKGPEQTGQELGQYLKENLSDVVENFNVVKGFLNLVISSQSWLELLQAINADEQFGFVSATEDSPLVMIEYSSPNTNKPLHLGHVRNNLLGSSLARIVAANGNKVVKTNIVNDRGIHICKSMLAWLKYGNGETPESSGKKGDHLVGDYYVKFNDLLKAEVAELVAGGMDPAEAEKNAPILREAQEMLVKWEQGDPEVRALWEKMNGWVYAGFDETYRRLGISFDRIYYESQTYKDGKALVEEGLKKGVLYRREDGSVWCDLTSDGLDEKLLLRKDGTSVYMTQDLGTAKQRHDEYGFDEMIYVVGNEQNYHFQVLSILLDRLGFRWGRELTHFSYGMVELPNGKMKSREGTVVDADDLLDRMYATAKETSLELGKLEGMSEQEQDALFTMLSLGALKYFILKVDPKKTMLFDPKESIDFNGNTGPFIQYTHARICSILRKAAEAGYEPKVTGAALLPKEEGIVQILSGYPDKIREAGLAHSPALIANFAYDLAKEFNQYYHDRQILREEDAAVRDQRLMLISVIARTLRHAMNILGISLPERM